MYAYFCRGQPPRSAVRTYLVHGGRSGVGRVGAPAIVGHIWIRGSSDCWAHLDMWVHVRAEDMVHCSNEPASADQLKQVVVSFSFFLLKLLPPVDTRSLP